MINQEHSELKNNRDYLLMGFFYADSTPPSPPPWSDVGIHYAVCIVSSLSIYIVLFRKIKRHVYLLIQIQTI